MKFSWNSPLPSSCYQFSWWFLLSNSFSDHKDWGGNDIRNV